MKKLFNTIFEIFDNKMNFSYLKRLGLVISLISIIFITTEFKDINFDLSNLNIEFLILSTFFMLLSYIMFGIAWANYLNKNINLEKKESFNFWAYSNLGKYVPGFVGIPLLRITQKEVKSKIMFFGLVEEQLIPVIILVPTSLILLNSNFSTNYFILFSFFIVILIKLMKSMFEKFNILNGKNSYVTSISILFFGFLSQYISIFLICNEIVSQNAHKLALLYTLSSSIALIVIGSPSGIGVRELILLQISKPIFNNEILLLVMFVARIVYLLSDSLTGIYGLIKVSIKKSN